MLPNVISLDGHSYSFFVRCLLRTEELSKFPFDYFSSVSLHLNIVPLARRQWTKWFIVWFHVAVACDACVPHLLRQVLWRGCLLRDVLRRWTKRFIVWFHLAAACDAQLSRFLRHVLWNKCSLLSFLSVTALGPTGPSLYTVLLSDG